MSENVWIFIDISLKFISMVQFMVLQHQTMAWCRIIWAYGGLLYWRIYASSLSLNVLKGMQHTYYIWCALSTYEFNVIWIFIKIPRCQRHLRYRDLIAHAYVPGIISEGFCTFADVISGFPANISRSVFILIDEVPSAGLPESLFINFCLRYIFNLAELCFNSFQSSRIRQMA